MKYGKSSEEQFVFKGLIVQISIWFINLVYLFNK